MIRRFLSIYTPLYKRHGLMRRNLFDNMSQNVEIIKPLQSQPSSVEKLDDEGALRLPFVIDYLVNQIKAVDVCVIDMRDKCEWTNYMVVCNGVSKSHVRQLANSFYLMAKKSIQVNTKKDEDASQNAPFSSQQLHIEGKKDDPEWKCVDLGNIIVHFFTEDARKAYDLEKLWKSSH